MMYCPDMTVEQHLCTALAEPCTWIFATTCWWPAVRAEDSRPAARNPNRERRATTTCTPRPRQHGYVLHLRIYAPNALTQRAAEVLAIERGVEPGRHPGCGTSAPGDLIMADIPAERPTTRSTGCEVWDSRTKAPSRSPAYPWISRHALQAEQDAPGGIGHRGLGGSDPEGLRDSELTWSYASFMILATLIAGIGIVLDSQILLIGAVAAMGLALVRRRRRLLRRAVSTLVYGFALAIAVTTVAATIARLLGWINVRAIEGPRP